MHKYLCLSLMGSLALSGCATLSPAPVQVVHALPSQMSVDAPIYVVPEPGEVDWSAEQALRHTGQVVSSDASWRLRVAERTVVRANTAYDPFCDRWPRHYQSYYGHYWGPHWNRDPWCQDRVSVRTTRLVFWALEDRNGRVVWQAQSREPQVNQPPELASIRLASELAAWRGVPLASTP